MTMESLPLLKGPVDRIVLKALSWGPMHGVGISTGREQLSDGSIGVDDSAMDQVLHRLEAKGFVEAEWQVTENNRRARYYALTPAGRARLAEERAAWRRLSRAVELVLQMTEG